MLQSSLKHVACDLDCSSPIITDQSDRSMCDINNIMASYARTGLLPHVNQAIAKYQDNTLAIPLEQAKQMLNDATNLFMELPAQVRKLMDNDPTKMDDFLKNPDNTDVLLKYKLIIPRELPQKQTTEVLFQVKAKRLKLQFK